MRYLVIVAFIFGFSSQVMACAEHEMQEKQTLSVEEKGKTSSSTLVTKEQ